MGIKEYIAIARPDNWSKNIFIFPGMFIAILLTGTSIENLLWPFCIGMASTCLIASANYVINEWLDAEFDKFHPTKKNRPSVNGNLKPFLVYTEYLVLSLGGLYLAYCASIPFFITIVFFLFMGIVYNVKPFRSKDIAVIDVLSESVNNPIRLILGWFIVTSSPLPPSSLICGYWMGGAFLMAVKRYSELRFIASGEIAGLYRESFKYYTEEKLLISIFFYGMSSAFFIGVFLVKYRIELLFSLPFLAILFT